jgi:hypothetical protein
VYDTAIERPSISLKSAVRHAERLQLGAATTGAPAEGGAPELIEP